MLLRFPPGQTARASGRLSFLTFLAWNAAISLAQCADAATVQSSRDSQAGTAIGAEVAVATASSATSPARTPIRRSGEESGTTPTRVGAHGLRGSLATLGIILAVLYLVFHWLRRHQPADAQLSPAAIDVLASRRLDAHGTVHLVRIGPRVLAIGSGAAGMRTLSVIDNPEEIALLVTSRSDDHVTRRRPRAAKPRGNPASDVPVYAARDENPADQVPETRKSA